MLRAEVLRKTVNTHEMRQKYLLIVKAACQEFVKTVKTVRFWFVWKKTIETEVKTLLLFLAHFHPQRVPTYSVSFSRLSSRIWI